MLNFTGVLEAGGFLGRDRGTPFYTLPFRGHLWRHQSQREPGAGGLHRRGSGLLLEQPRGERLRGWRWKCDRDGVRQQEWQNILKCTGEIWGPSQRFAASESSELSRHIYPMRWKWIRTPYSAGGRRPRRGDFQHVWCTRCVCVYWSVLN